MASAVLICTSPFLSTYLILEVVERDATKQRGKRPFIFTNLKEGDGLDLVIDWLEKQINLARQNCLPKLCFSIATVNYRKSQ